MKTIAIVGSSILFSAGTFTIGVYIGKEHVENKLGPKFADLLERIKYLENGITKS